MYKKMQISLFIVGLMFGNLFAQNHAPIISDDFPGTGTTKQCVSNLDSIIVLPLVDFSTAPDGDSIIRVIGTNGLLVSSFRPDDWDCSQTTNEYPYQVDAETWALARKLLDSKETPELPFPNPHPDAQWFPKAGFGLFMHWGIHSVAGIQPSWAMIKDYPYGYVLQYGGMKYYSLAKEFNPQNYDPDKWIKAAKSAGMTYAVLTTKHHDGYALWPTKYGNMSTRQYMNGRDLLKPYVDACRRNGVKVGFYFSPRDWHFPGYPVSDYKFDHNLRGKRPPVTDHKKNRQNWEKFFAYTIGQLYELLTRYGKIDVLWFDGINWPEIKDLRGAQVYAWIRSLQPGIVINPRWGDHLGDFQTPEVDLPDGPPKGWWENCISIYGHWGYSALDPKCKDSFWPTEKVLERLVRIRSWGGNFLMNIGPAPDGTMPPQFYKLTDDLGNWLSHSGEALLDVGLSPNQAMSNVMITSREKTWYLHVLSGNQGPIELNTTKKPVSVKLLRTGEDLPLRISGNKQIITLSADQRGRFDDVIIVHWP